MQAAPPFVGRKAGIVGAGLAGLTAMAMNQKNGISTALYRA